MDDREFDPTCACGPEVNRRGLLQLGLGGYLGMSLLGSDLLRADEGTDTGKRMPGKGQAKHCIVLYMAGGMSQTDTFDPKPGTLNAGPLKAIKTSAKGVQFSEYLPGLAEQANKLAVLRSMSTREGAHDRARYLLHTGYAISGTVKHPDLGALIAQATHDEAFDMPAYVHINGSPIGPGFIGVEHAPFTVANAKQPVANLGYPKKVDGRRWGRRRKLLVAIEKRFKKDHPGGETEGHTKVYSKADRLMHSAQVKAFNLAEEPKLLRTAYGDNAFGQGCLMARRLVQAGVKAVEVQLGGWDTHEDNFTKNKRNCEMLDAGFATLMRDLADKGLLKKTLVLLVTEFGRTPTVNKKEGRDHWAKGWSVVMGGASIKGGQALGSTNKDGSKVAETPIAAQDMMASVMHALGVDTTKLNYTREGRPLRVVDKAGKVLPELFRA